jgi:hypothetical protein
MQIPCVYLPGPAPAVTVANKYFTVLFCIIIYYTRIIIYRTLLSFMFYPTVLSCSILSLSLSTVLYSLYCSLLSGTLNYKCTLLYSTFLFSTVLWCTTRLHSTVLYCIVHYSFVLWYIFLCIYSTYSANCITVYRTDGFELCSIALYYTLR